MLQQVRMILCWTVQQCDNDRLSLAETVTHPVIPPRGIFRKG